MLERRSWTWVDKALFGIYTAWFAMGVFIFLTRPIPLSGTTGGIPVLPLLIVVTVCYAAPMIVWRPGYVHTNLFPLAVLLLSGTLQVVLCYLSHEHISVMLIPMLIIGYLANRYNIWWTFPSYLIALPVASIVAAHSAYPLATFLNDSIVGLIFFAIGFIAQRGIDSNNRMRLLLEENIRQYTLISEQNKVLEQYAKQIEQVTLLEERNRLARELHDTVGHTFTSVIMGMDAVSYLLETAPDKAKGRLEVLREVTRKGLDEVRKSIHQIAPDDSGTLSQQISRLCNEFAVHTGTNIRIKVSGQETDLPKQTQLTLIRCLQESLTNAKRHGGAQKIEAALTFAADQVELRIEDDGIGTDQLEKGFGLTAMKDRLAALQGDLLIASNPGSGTHVICTVPVHS